MVYVEDTQRGLRTCKMIADTLDELHTCASVLGVDRRHFHGLPKHDSHYVVTPSQRADLILLSLAMLVDKRILAAMVTRRRITGEVTLAAPLEAWKWWLDYCRKVHNSGFGNLHD